jgi:hypothetical protein
MRNCHITKYVDIVLRACSNTRRLDTENGLMQQQRAGSKLTDLQPNASAVPNTEPWGLLWDFTTLREFISTLPDNSTLQNKALSVANAMMNTFY